MSNSIATTVGISTVGTSIVPVLQWLFPTLPMQVCLTFAAMLVGLGHVLHELAVRKGWYPTYDDASPAKNVSAPLDQPIAGAIPIAGA